MQTELAMLHLLPEQVVTEISNVPHSIDYEFISIWASVSALVIHSFTADKIRLRYLNLKQIDAPMQPVRLLGIKGSCRWKLTGSSIDTTITNVTGVVE